MWLSRDTSTCQKRSVACRHDIAVPHGPRPALTHGAESPRRGAECCCLPHGSGGTEGTTDSSGHAAPRGQTRGTGSVGTGGGGEGARRRPDGVRAGTWWLVFSMCNHRYYRILEHSRHPRDSVALTPLPPHPAASPLPGCGFASSGHFMEAESRSGRVALCQLRSFRGRTRVQSAPACPLLRGGHVGCPPSGGGESCCVHTRVQVFVLDMYFR